MYNNVFLFISERNLSFTLIYLENYEYQFMASSLKGSKTSRILQE